jgi:hypothetical protein
MSPGSGSVAGEFLIYFAISLKDCWCGDVVMEAKLISREATGNQIQWENKNLEWAGTG